VLHIHRAERADTLVDALGELLGDPLGDAMGAEIIAVPSRGIERWLTQRLAGHLGSSLGRTDGVCANIAFPFPASLIGRAIASASSVEPDREPWSPQRSVWPLLEVVDSHLSSPWLSPLAGHLHNAGPVGEVRRFAAVRHIADLYDRYSVHRPEMLLSWAKGEDQGTSPESRWQAELWRRLRARIGTPSPAERLTQTCDALRHDATLADLPERISLFGLTRLPASYLDVVGALAAQRDVHLFLLHPSPALWEKLGRQHPQRSLRRADDPTADVPANPLLGSWGRDAREMQLVLASTGQATIDHHREAEAAPSSLLGHIQADIRADRSPPGIPPPGHDDGRMLLEHDDRSIEVHACHGKARQVEILRDVVLHLLAEDPDLEPRDIVVMCPDIETYAPFIDATFGAAEPMEDDERGEAHHPDLRVRLADRSLRQTNPVLGVVARLLELASARVTASEVLDLAGRDPVRRRFGFDDDDLARLEEWVVGSGIRWGFDAARREPYKLEALEANTWRAGLDRTLVGVTMADEGQRLVGGVVPLDDVDSGDIELVGRFTEFVDRLDTAITALGQSHPIGDWATVLASCTDALMATSERDVWQRRQLDRLLEELTGEATFDDAVVEVTLEPGDVVSLLADRLRGAPTRANFRTGHLTICTLVPMRSVPHKAVCLLGLDDGAFPRVNERDGDDLILADPYVGDRDPRSEDRQLLLDALLAATEHLVVIYTGRDERSNLARPPAVPVGELLDVVDRTARTTDGTPARTHVVVHHPLQPFDVRNFTIGALVAERPWSFDTVNFAGAQASEGLRHAPPLFLPGPLPEVESTTIELDDLDRFLRHPVGAFLRQRLGIRLGASSQDVDDGLPVELDALERWAVGDRLLTAHLAGADLDACVAAERARGLLPPGALAERILGQVIPDVEVIVAAAHDGVTPTSLDVNVTLSDGTRLVGTVPDVRDDVIRSVSFSRLAPNRRLETWLRLLALTYARPERPFESVTIGRLRDSGPPGNHVSMARVTTLGNDDAARHTAAGRYLEDLVALYRRGMCEPLPIYTNTSAAWAKAAPTKRRALAEKQWTSAYNFPKEDAEAEHRAVLGGVVPFAKLLEGPPLADESGEGWDAAEESRFGRYARRLWSGLLEHEKVTDQ
jgi:exodeoxyribonuclease V gamma subunit